MKGFYIIKIFTILNTLCTSISNVFRNASSVGFLDPVKSGKDKKISNLLQSGFSFSFRHRSRSENPIPFRMMPLKELLFFKALISRLQIHSVCTIGEKF